MFGRLSALNTRGAWKEEEGSCVCVFHNPIVLGEKNLIIINMAELGGSPKPILTSEPHRSLSPQTHN